MEISLIAMQFSQFFGKRVGLMVSDPWDFGTECGVGPFYGHIADLSAEQLLIVLECPIKYSNIPYLSAICQVRHEGISIADLRVKGPVSMNVTLLAVSAKRLADIKDDDLRRGIAAIGTVELS